MPYPRPRVIGVGQARAMVDRPQSLEPRKDPFFTEPDSLKESQATSITNPFLRYKAAHDRKESDSAVIAARIVVEKNERALEQAKELLEAARQPYHAELADIEAELAARVLLAQKTTEEHGVVAKFRKASRSTSWKAVATEMEATEEIIEKHSKHGDASIHVEIRTVEP